MKGFNVTGRGHVNKSGSGRHHGNNQDLVKGIKHLVDHIGTIVVGSMGPMSELLATVEDIANGNSKESFKHVMKKVNAYEKKLEKDIRGVEKDINKVVAFAQRAKNTGHGLGEDGLSRNILNTIDIIEDQIEDFQNMSNQLESYITALEEGGHISKPRHKKHHNANNLQDMQGKFEELADTVSAIEESLEGPLGPDSVNNVTNTLTHLLGELSSMFMSLKKEHPDVIDGELSSEFKHEIQDLQSELNDIKRQVEQ